MSVSQRPFDRSQGSERVDGKLGSGMGKELAIQLAAKGAKVAINDWNRENLEATVTTNIIKKSGKLLK